MITDWNETEIRAKIKALKQYIDDTFNTFNNKDLINEIDSLDFHYNKRHKNNFYYNFNTSISYKSKLF